MSLLLDNAHVVTMDDEGSEHPDGWVLIANGRVEAVGGSIPPEAAERVDLEGAVVTPGLVNTHHHLYQTLTRARAQEADLFTWLRELYPVWAGIDEESVYAAARTGLAELALSGCTTVFDHHYVFPRGTSGLIEAEVRAARELGVRIVASRGSMDLGESDGGLPPDSLVEELDDVLADTERLAGLQDEDGLVQLAVAPCSPFSVTGRLMRESAELARRLGLKLHTHLAETVEEEAYCQELYGCRPVEYLESLGWIASDVWCAHCVHLNGDDVRAFADGGVGVAHCPTSNMRLGAGHRARSHAARRECPGRPRRGRLRVERARRSASSRSSRRCSSRGSRRACGAHGARCAAPRHARRRGRPRPRRSRLARAGQARRHSGVANGHASNGRVPGPGPGLVFSAPHRVDRLYVGGEEVVRDGRLVHADEDEIARHHRVQAGRFAP